MRRFLASLLDDYHAEMERRRGRPFLRAAMAACALAATADGEVTFAERIRVDQILDTLERLKIFDPHEAVALFNEYASAILAAPRDGRERAHETIADVTGEDPASAALIVRLCLAVAEADGEKSLVEQIEIVMLCSLIGVAPRDAGLYTDGEPGDVLGG